jgi:Fic family protein
MRATITPNLLQVQLGLGASWEQLYSPSPSQTCSKLGADMKTPTPAPPLGQVITSMADMAREELLEFMTMSVDDSNYLHWDKLRHKTPPKGLTHDQWWFLLKSSRQRNARTVPFSDKKGKAFTYVLTDRIIRACEDVAQRASGQIRLPEIVTKPRTRNEYVVSSLIEEAITSSQLEGASTSRNVAKEMLRSGRAPTSKSERMIVNNFHAMKFVREIVNQDLTPELVCEIHRIVTDGTLDDPLDAGRLDQPGQNRVAVYGEDDQLLHMPPAAEQLPDRLVALCRFANAQEEDGSYLSPVVRAIVVHFMMGYDHYFADGNGRTARALFYWCMLRNGYWITEFLTISTILKKAPSKYSFAYLLTEDDDSDLTYFIHFHLDVVQRALDELTTYLERKVAELRSVRQVLDLARDEYTHRQVQVLEFAVEDPGYSITVKDFSGRFSVSDETARHDLNQLVDRGFLVKHRRGKQFVWTPVPKLSDKLGENKTQTKK